MWIYPITAILAFIMAWFDGTIEGLLIKLKIEQAGVRNRQELLADLNRKINLANADYAAGIITAAERNQRINDYRKTVAILHK
jgi:hypothetical protein